MPLAHGQSRIIQNDLIDRQGIMGSRQRESKDTRRGEHMPERTSIKRGRSAPTNSVFLYDADCSVCLRSVLFLQKLGCRLEFQPLQDSGRLGFKLDLVRAQSEVPIVQSDGTIIWGFRAWTYALYNSGHLGRLAASLLELPVLCRIGRQAYRYVSIKRSKCHLLTKCVN